MMKSTPFPSGLRGGRPFATLAVFLAAVLGACATQVTLPPLPDCHPANPDAPTAQRASPAPLGSALGDVETGSHGAMDHGAMGHEMDAPSDGETVYTICGMALNLVEEPDKPEDAEGHGEHSHHHGTDEEPPALPEEP